MHITELLALAYYGNSPRKPFSEAYPDDDTDAAEDWINSNVLVDIHSRLTPKGRALLDEILSTPMPVETTSFEFLRE